MNFFLFICFYIKNTTNVLQKFIILTTINHNAKIDLILSIQLSSYPHNLDNNINIILGVCLYVLKVFIQRVNCTMCENAICECLSVW